MAAKEPKRVCDLNLLEPEFREKIELLLAELRKYPYKPVLFETWRSAERQNWLYGVGRTHDRARKPVTWTLNSKHMSGIAVDIIDNDSLWSSKLFFQALGSQARKLGLYQAEHEPCHIQMRK